MAEPNRTPTPKKTAAKATTRTVTAQSRKPADRSAAVKSAKNTKTADTRKKSAPKSDPRQQDISRAERDAKREARSARRSRFSEQFLPYILGAVSLFLLVCFVLNLLSGNATPAEHKMGYVGYYICEALFGCLGWAAYLIPILLGLLTFLWRRYCREGKVVSKLVLATLLTLILSSLGHVILCQGDPALAETYAPGELYRTGAILESGGVIGGLIGYALFLALRLPGTIVLAVITLPLIIMCLVGVTPVYVFGKIADAVKEKHAASVERARLEDEADRADAEAAKYKTRRMARDQVARNETPAYDEDDLPDDEDDVYDDEEDEVPAARPARKKKSVKSAKAAKATPADELDEDLPEDGLPENGDAAPASRIIRLDSETGEVLDDEPAPAAKGKRRRVSTAEPEEEETYSMPLYDKTPAETPRETPRETSREARRSPSIVEAVAASRAPVAPAEDDLPWEDAEAEAAPVEDILDEDFDPNMDAMAVSFDDEPHTADAPHRRVSYEVLESDGSAAGEHRSGEPVTVRILKAETGAVDERGLSEEELVLPSGHSDLEHEAPAEDAPAREYLFPSVDMLAKGPSRYETNEEEIAENTQILRDVLESFRIGVQEISCSCGPTITRFEVKPSTGVRVRSIANLVDDIAMGLAKAGVRIEAPIPGKSAVGIEVPNAEPSTVYLRNILETPEFRNHKSRIAACLGADVSGRPVILDINKMPHLLIAGATGTGKSVCINSLVMSILFKAKPDEVKLILIDPKKVEFAMYRDLPHLYAPVVSDPKKAAGALNSAVNEMERRFELIEEVGVRNLAGYNEITAGDPERPPLPQMVIIIDELADLMMTAPAEVETAICRLAQKARAAGIHLIIGTQRPSVDVITGLIKANVPSRIAFTVKSGVDSRTILDTVGADKLIGRGDMLYAPIGCNKPIRAQGCFVSETEVERVVTFIKENNDPPVYNEEFTRSIDMEAAKCGKKKGEQMDIDDFDGIGGGRGDGEDPKFWEALEIVVTKDKIGTSALQRGCNLGYGRAAKIIDRMEELGFVGPDPGTKQGRKVMITKQELIQYKMNGLPGSGGASEEGEAL